MKKETEQKLLIQDNLTAYQNVEEGKIGVDKDDSKDDESSYSGLNEIKNSSNIKQDIERIKTKCKFKEELVDNDIVLSVNHLKQYFFFGKGPNRYKLKAVHDVSFDIKSNECFGIVGESGCGKTTTGRSIIRLYNITSGSIYYKGYRIGAGSRWNDKEIKFTKIRLNQKIKDLNLALKNDIKKLNEEKEAKITSLKEQNLETNKLNEELSKINEEYSSKVSELKAKTKEEISTHKTNANEIITVQREKIKQIKYDNRHVDRTLLNEIQMIFQDPIDSLDPRMTVEDIIKEGLTISKKVEVRITKQQSLVDIKELKEKYAGEENKEILAQKINEVKTKAKEKIRSIKNRNDHDRVVEVLEKVGLIADYANRYPHEFSGGQRQRIGIARALIMNPKLLICDEPISALDVSIRAQIINLLNELKEEMGLSIIFIAHDLSVVKYFCDRIAVMYFGEIVELASSDELYKHPLHPYTKSLLSAIPKPNPLTEKTRQRIVYNPKEAHDYSKEKPKLVEIAPNHFILANSEEVIKYKEEIEKIDLNNK